MFGHGEMRLLLLAMLSEQPSHGYELIKAVEERFGGAYAPSPGVIYPTLAWLDDMGYAAVDAAEGERKRYRVTPEGEAFLAVNREAADELLSRPGYGMGGAPTPVLRAMRNLRTALRLRLRAGALTAEQVDAIADVLDAAARSVERL